MNEGLATWEMIALGAIAVVVLLLFFPGLKTIIRDSREAEKDWPGLIIPIGVVVVFVIFLVMIV